MTTTTERPISFTAEMVCAILEGRKTVTRRPLKPQPADDIRLYQLPNPEHIGYVSSIKHKYGSRTTHICPLGQPGERLWVRERTLVIDYVGDNACVRYLADNSRATVPFPERLKRVEPGKCIANGCHKEGSRITLEITGVRVERLQTITEEEAKAEGATPAMYPITPPETPYRDGFSDIWRSIYGDDGWNSNPWVWVVEFKRVEESA